MVPKASTSDEQTIMYYVNDGIYGSFNCLFFDNDHQTVTINTLKDEEKTTYECSVWGPTCDSIDCIIKSAKLPMHEVGDWLYCQDMGAYTVAAASTFNGMQPPSKMYHCLEELWYQVKSHRDNLENKSNVMLQSMKTEYSVLEAVDYDDVPQTLYSEGIVIGQINKS